MEATVEEQIPEGPTTTEIGLPSYYHYFMKLFFVLEVMVNWHANNSTAMMFASIPFNFAFVVIEMKKPSFDAITEIIDTCETLCRPEDDQFVTQGFRHMKKAAKLDALKLGRLFVNLTKSNKDSSLNRRKVLAHLKKLFNKLLSDIQVYTSEGPDALPVGNGLVHRITEAYKSLTLYADLLNNQFLDIVDTLQETGEELEWVHTLFNASLEYKKPQLIGIGHDHLGACQEKFEHFKSSSQISALNSRLNEALKMKDALSKSYNRFIREHTTTSSRKCDRHVNKQEFDNAAVLLDATLIKDINGTFSRHTAAFSEVSSSLAAWHTINLRTCLRV